ncbi:hypothetical protein HD593_010062 [Nonomuraea rubra]|uniref:Uncharacterized protein n=1 Tax=Nonomuraea rubra TaxID=46180 RepID=A0A7X0P4U3_9ACTN|nr:hypothetical protein [Nonomuraea rubra]
MRHAYMTRLTIVVGLILVLACLAFAAIQN